jgi:hypothetical protein
MRTEFALTFFLLVCAAALTSSAPARAFAQTPRRALNTRDLDGVTPPKESPRPAPAAGDAQGGQQQPATAQEGPCVFARPVDPAYFETAESSGGQMYMLAPSEIGHMTELSNLDANGFRESIFRAGGDLNGEAREFVVPLDASVGRAAFVAFVECKESITITSPDGREAATGAFLANRELRAGRLLTVNAPAAGEWRVRLQGRGKFTLAVKAQTDLSLSTLITRGVPGGETDYRVRMTGVESGVSLNESEVRLKLLTEDGAEIQSVELRRVPGDRPDITVFAAVTSTPPRRFRVAVEGRNAQGQTVLRVHPPLQRPPGE